MLVVELLGCGRGHHVLVGDGRGVAVTGVIDHQHTLLQCLVEFLLGIGIIGARCAFGMIVGGQIDLLEDEFVVIGFLQRIDQLIVVAYVAVERITGLVVIAKEAETVFPCAKIGVVAIVDDLAEHVVRHFNRADG